MNISLDNNFFTHAHAVMTTPHANDLVFIFDDNHDKIALLNNQRIPRFTDIYNAFNVEKTTWYRFGNIASQQCLISMAQDSFIEHEDISWQTVKTSFQLLQTPYYVTAIFAKHIADWQHYKNFCTRCANPLSLLTDERGKICDHCKLTYYPTLHPCVLILIKKQDEILLARSHHFPPGMFSLLAGYIEPGENVEQAIKRETYEEVGIEIKNITYRASQPWPFSESLMLGFTADYASGNIQIDNREIESAAWFNKNNLPERLPSDISLSNYLINQYWLK